MGAFMISIQTYKSFFNSSDFEKLYFKSEPSLLLYYSDIENFKKNILKQAILNKTIEILYKHNESIGYFIYELKKRNLHIHFYYICPNNKNRQYGRQFREIIYSKLQHKFETISFSINKKNHVSINAAIKTCKKLNLKNKNLNNLDLHPKQLHFMMEKPLTLSENLLS
jgi:hypothetical protein